MRRILFSMILLMLTLLSCTAPPETRAGTWEVNTEYGDFILYISDDGQTITRADYEFECKGMQAANNHEFQSAIEITDREFGMWVGMGFLKMASWEGKFSANGKKLTGTVTFSPDEIDGGCPTSFSVSR